MRSRPARSGRTSTSTRPAARASAATCSPCVGTDLGDEPAARRQPSGRGADDAAEGVEAIGAGEECLGRLPVAHVGDQLVVLGHVGRVRHHQVEPSPQVGRECVEPVALRPRGRWPRAGRSRPGWRGRRRGRRVRRRSPRPPRRSPGARRRATGRWLPTRYRGRRSASGLGRPSSRARATSTTCSVSGRGIRTRRSTRRSSRRKLQCPSTYCSGSPVRRRATMASSRATARCVAPSSRPWSQLRPSRPEASWQSHRASSAEPPSRSLVSTHSARQRDRGAAAHEAPESWRARSSAISGSTTSSRLPASTSWSR